MSPGTGRWRRLRAVFDEVVELPLGERQARLSQLTEGYPALRFEVESLLIAERTAGDRFESAPPLVSPIDG